MPSAARSQPNIRCPSFSGAYSAGRTVGVPVLPAGKGLEFSALMRNTVHFDPKLVTSVTGWKGRRLVYEWTQQTLPCNPVLGRYEDTNEQVTQRCQLAEPPRMVDLTISVTLSRDLRGVLIELRGMEGFGPATTPAHIFLLDEDVRPMPGVRIFERRDLLVR
jgi:hypothetical protein